MVKKIEKPIVAYSVEKKAEASGEDPNVIALMPPSERPEYLEGSTYKLKTPLSTGAVYITINDVVMNEGTEFEHRRPFEMFINSKDMTQFQWIVALTRVISAVFRKGGDVTFLVEELKSVFDPAGGYLRRGKYVPSIVHELGEILEQHLQRIGMLDEPSHEISTSANDTEDPEAGVRVKPSGPLCPECQQPMVVQEGCTKCLQCGESRCG